jgi:hypothetical protein
MEISNPSFKASCDFFIGQKCCSDGRAFSSDGVFTSLDEEKMMCLIINCLAALYVIQNKRMEITTSANKKHELVKRKVFEKACSTLINADCDTNRSVIKESVLSAFPDKRKMSNGQSWLPLHFAIVLFAEEKISEEDVQTLYSIDPMAMHRLSNNNQKGTVPGCTPAHLLCMQKQPSMSLVRFFCLRNPKAFLLCDQYGRSVLHLVVQYTQRAWSSFNPCCRLIIR